MAIGIVAIYDDKLTEGLPIIGTGKTQTLVYYQYCEYEEEERDIYCNFETTFGEKMGILEILNKIKEGKIKNASVGISELQGILNSLGSKSQDILFSEKIIMQLRKRKVKLYWDSQRYMSVVNRVRFFTTIILKPEKEHLDETPCYDPECEKEHLIKIYSESPYFTEPIQCLIASEVGKLYNTFEFIDDEINLKSEREQKLLEKLKEKNNIKPLG